MRNQSHVPFLRPTIKQTVLETHKNIRESYRDMTLLEILIQPINRVLRFNSVQKAELKAKMCGSAEPDFSGYGYTMLEENYMMARWKFVRAAVERDVHEFLEASEVSAHDINGMTELSEAPTVLLALKFFYLVQGHPNRKFLGFPAVTAPVRLAGKTFFGNDLRDFWQSKAIHTRLASELNRSEMYVNTALWVIGSEIQAEIDKVVRNKAKAKAARQAARRAVESDAALL